MADRKPQRALGTGTIDHAPGALAKPVSVPTSEHVERSFANSVLKHSTELALSAKANPSPNMSGTNPVEKDVAVSPTLTGGLSKDVMSPSRILMFQLSGVPVSSGGNRKTENFRIGIREEVSPIKKVKAAQKRRDIARPRQLEGNGSIEVAYQGHRCRVRATGRGSSVILS
jgi:hypothetical protein